MTPAKQMIDWSDHFAAQLLCEAAIRSGLLMLLFTSAAVLLMQCCGCCKKKGKKNKGGGTKKDVLPPPATTEETQGTTKNKKPKKKQKQDKFVRPYSRPQTGYGGQALPGVGAPRMIEDKQKQAGMGMGEEYRTLGNIDMNIFLEGGSKPTPEAPRPIPPPTPPKKSKPKATKQKGEGLRPEEGPKMMEDIQQKPGMATGEQYQTLGALNQDIFVEGKEQQKPAPAAAGSLAPPPAAAVQGSLAGPGGSSSHHKEAEPIPGHGNQQDYQTWNVLDQNVFVKGGKEQPPAPAAVANLPAPALQGSLADFGEDSSHHKEAEPIPGLGNQQDYQTWNVLDQNVFVDKNK